MERAGAFHGAVKYRTDLFEELTIRKLASNYVALLERVVGEPETTLGQFLATMDVKTNSNRADDNLIEHPDKIPLVAAASPQANSSEELVEHLIQRLQDIGLRFQLDFGRLKVNAPKGVMDEAIKAAIAKRRTDIVNALSKQGAADLARAPEAIAADFADAAVAAFSSTTSVLVC